MITKLALIFFFISLCLTSCNHLPTASTQVEHHSLLRSMTYTHRHLLELELGNTDKTSEQRQQLLLSSHCDLIDRRMVYAKVPPPACPSVTPTSKVCVAEFHRWLGLCPNFKRYCKICEQEAIACLNKPSSK